MIEEINKHNTLIKISDRSLAGWVLMGGYILDELARDSEDDKNLKAVEYPVLKKRDIKIPDSKTIKTSYSF